MANRYQKESLLLGSVFGGVVGLVAVFAISLLPTFNDETGTTPVSPDTAAATDTSIPSTNDRRGGPPEGRGPANVDPLTFGTADQDVLDAFAAGGCVACHAIKGVGGQGAIVGPFLFQTGALAATRRPGASAAAYIEESIRNPDAFIMPNCPNGACPSGVMPKTLGDTLSDEQISTIVSYLAALGTDAETGVLNP